MGLVYAEIELTSGDDLVLFARGYLVEPEIKKLTVKALVDSGATMLVIPESVKTQLNLRKLEERKGELADGSIVRLDVVGPLEIKFANRRSTVNALVVPGDTEILLGAIPMQDMDVLIDPKQEKLIVNPESPDIAIMSLKHIY